MPTTALSTADKMNAADEMRFSKLSNTDGGYIHRLLYVPIVETSGVRAEGRTDYLM